MWKGYEEALKLYYNFIVLEWKTRTQRYNNMELYEVGKDIKYPNWLGDEELHLSHRLNLLKKDYDHYSKYFTEEVKKYSREEIDNIDSYKWI